MYKRQEGARFGGGLFGSRAMAGKLTQQELQTFRDKDGISSGEAMAAFGLDPEKIGDAVRPQGSIHAFIELHIEQGKVCLLYTSFPERINTEFVRVVNPLTIKMRVWERGSGETTACGTGACAAVVAAVATGQCEKGTDVTVKRR